MKKKIIGALLTFVFVSVTLLPTKLIAARVPLCVYSSDECMWGTYDPPFIIPGDFYN